MKRLRDELRTLPIPGAAAAEERAWDIVRLAHAERLRVHRPRSRRPLVIAFAAAAVVVAAALSPPGLAVLGSVRDALAPERHVKAALVTLPAPGRLLVTTGEGAWIVSADGSKRRLGAYRDAVWSPHGLFVAAVRGHQLVALEPDGTARWTLTRTPAPRLPAWNAPDGYRVAYLSGTTLRIVNGNGTGDRALAHGVATVRPSWRPGNEHVLAYVRANGTVVVAGADTGRVLWTRRWSSPPRQLTWSRDGRRLLVVAPTRIRVYDERGRAVAFDDPSDATRAVAAAFRPGTHQVVEIRRHGTASTAFLLRGGATLFTTPGVLDGLAWSPDGRWLLLGWRSADQWLFVRVAPKRRMVLTFGAISDAFDPGAAGRAGYPRLAGWCCGR